MIYDEMEDRPNPADERAEAWEYWHERANKFEAENYRLRAVLAFIVSQQDHSFVSPVALLAQCIDHARAALLPKDGTKP